MKQKQTSLTKIKTVISLQSTKVHLLVNQTHSMIGLQKGRCSSTMKTSARFSNSYNRMIDSSGMKSSLRDFNLSPKEGNWTARKAWVTCWSADSRRQVSRSLKTHSLTLWGSRYLSCHLKMQTPAVRMQITTSWKGLSMGQVKSLLMPCHLT